MILRYADWGSYVQDCGFWMMNCETLASQENHNPNLHSMYIHSSSDAKVQLISELAKKNFKLFRNSLIVNGKIFNKDT